MNSIKIRTILPNRIRTFRNSKGLTQEQLAEKGNIHPTYISRIESGKRFPTLVILCKIADVLEVEIYELFMDERKIASSDYKMKRLVSILRESSPSGIDIYSTLLYALHKKYEKHRR